MSGTQWLLLGGGGHAHSVAAMLFGRGDTVAAWAGDGTLLSHLDAVRFDDDATALRWAAEHDLAVALGVGDAAVRARLLGAARAASLPLPPVVAASAVVSPNARLGVGAVVGELAMVGPGVTLGAGTIVNSGALVEHDCSVGDLTHVAPRATLLGAVTAGAGCLIGAGAVVLPTVRLGERVRVGAGAVVTADVAGDATVVGVPAREPRGSAGSGW